jgi:hypothetical protein
VPSDTESRESTSAASIFTPYERERLEQIQRFLVHIVDPEIARRAARVHYDGDEHRLGWADWAAAVGMNVPFSHHLSEAEARLAAEPGGVAAARLRELDTFENLWHPRCRTAIRRFVDASERDAFEAAFYEDLPQQPLGPLVPGSVRKLIARYEAMARSKVPGVKDAHRSLQRKGLTEAALDRAKALLAEIEAVPDAPATPAVSPAEIAASARARREAYDRLNLWYTDWAEVLRGELGYHALVRLGLTEAKGGRRAAPEPGEPAEE